MKRKEKALPYAAEEFYVHGPVHRESMSVIVQQDATTYSFIISLYKQLYMFWAIPVPIIRSTRKL
jgi:hypothetical protein